MNNVGVALILSVLLTAVCANAGQTLPQLSESTIRVTKYCPLNGICFSTTDSSFDDKSKQSWQKWHKELAVKLSETFDKTYKHRAIPQTLFKTACSYQIRDGEITDIKFVDSSGYLAFDLCFAKALKSLNDTSLLKPPIKPRHSSNTETVAFVRHFRPDPNFHKPKGHTPVSPMPVDVIDKWP